MDYQETELRLGLPGGNGSNGNCNKRGFSETVDLKLELASKDSSQLPEEKEQELKEKKDIAAASADLSKPPAKAQVVGWPPVRSFRKNILAVHKNGNSAENDQKCGAAFVKVSVDGAPYLRKVDLKNFHSYQQLSDALSKMFSSFTIGHYRPHEFKDFMNENNLMDLLNGSDYVPTYEDKDGDWMLVGDVPWEMFVNSCKRLRIIKGSEAIGLATSRSKNRS